MRSIFLTLLKVPYVVLILCNPPPQTHTLLGILANIPRIRGSEKNKIFGGEEHVKKKKKN